MTNKRAGFMTPGVRDRVLMSLELYLEGNTWPKIAEKGGYSWARFSRLMVEYPDLGKAYSEARRSSGHSFEDKALGLAEELTAPNKFSGSQVQAHKAAMEQYRWSASRRNPTEYAEAGAKQVSVVVPIQINSSLDLSTGTDNSPPPAASIWEVQAKVINGEIAAERTPEEAQGEPPDDLEVESDQQEAESPRAASPVALDSLADRLGLPEKLQSAVPVRPSTGRPRKKHKNLSDTVLTAHRYAIKKKSPSVAAALASKEPANEPSIDAGDQSPRSDKPE